MPFNLLPKDVIHLFNQEQKKRNHDQRMRKLDEQMQQFKAKERELSDDELDELQKWRKQNNAKALEEMQSYKIKHSKASNVGTYKQKLQNAQSVAKQGTVNSPLTVQPKR